MYLKINMVLRVSNGSIDGVYRVIALPPGENLVFLYRLFDEKPEVSIDDDALLVSKTRCTPRLEKLISIQVDVIIAMAMTQEVEQVDFKIDPKYRQDIACLTEGEQSIFEKRRKAGKLFLDHQLVCEALLSTRGIGKLIAQLMQEADLSRATCYRLWELLCRNGFHLSSMNPRLDRCGGPGEIRAWVRDKPKAGRKTLKERLGIPEPRPQVGVTIEDRQKIIATYRVLSRDPKLKFETIYLRTINNCFITKFKDVAGVVSPITPIQGSYPNKEQVRRVIHQETSRLDRKLAHTTRGHFDRNHRGLKGKSWAGIAGPGHIYAIDSTVGDIFLRSRINRAWSIGRPIVYIVVDVWSTAVVGFYVCLTGPSWATAKMALFSTVANAHSLSNLWGENALPQLSPPPTLPHAFLCDRGEYLSKGAQATGEMLGVNMQYNPSYRPDLKGIVEVLHRIAKDQQFQFIPGAIDARRKEIDMRANPRDSIFTLEDYVIYLSEIFVQYNFFSDRSYRLNTDMIADAVDPSPAGLWRYGHDVGVGYQKDDLPTRLMTSLLPSQSAAIRKDGVYLGGLKYEAAFVQEKMWPSLARNFGVMESSMHYFPGNNSKIWWPDPENGTMQELLLSPTALAAPGISFDEWFDARAHQRAKRNDKEHSRIVSALDQHSRTQALIARANEETKKADSIYEGALPPLRDAKSMETSNSIGVPAPKILEKPVSDSNSTGSKDAYESLMAELFSQENLLETKS